MEMVALETLEDKAEIDELKSLIEQHQEHTGSGVAAELLADWSAAIASFVKVMPVDYRKMQAYMSQARASGDYQTDDQVAEAAFNMHLKNLAAQKA